MENHGKVAIKKGSASSSKKILYALIAAVLMIGGHYLYTYWALGNDSASTTEKAGHDQPSPHNSGTGFDYYSVTKTTNSYGLESQTSAFLGYYEEVELPEFNGERPYPNYRHLCGTFVITKGNLDTFYGSPQDSSFASEKELPFRVLLDIDNYNVSAEDKKLVEASTADRQIVLNITDYKGAYAKGLDSSSCESTISDVRVLSD